MLAALALALALQAPAATAAPGFASHLAGDDGLVLAAGERVTVKLGDDNRLTLVSISAADPVQALPPRPRAPHPADDLSPDEGALTLLMGPVADATVLKIDSGVSRAFDYRAQLLTSAADKAGPAVAVCTVLPLLPSFEQWEHRHGGALLLNHFRLRATNEVVCGDGADVPKP